MKVLKKCAILCSLFLTVNLFSGCGQEKQALPEYENNQFKLAGFWAPYDQTEEDLKLYKDAGLNTFMMENHGVLPWSSDNLYYLGSNRTSEGLKLCKKLGLKVIINYGEWTGTEVEGKDSFGETPFSDRNYYSEYADIISGVLISDEPKASAMKDIGNDEFTSDFKKVYSVPYMVNLLPSYALSEQLDARNYDEYLKEYDEQILFDFDGTKCGVVSVDFYPFRGNVSGLHDDWLMCYEKVAKLAKKHSFPLHCYIQSASGNEFKSELTEADIRLQDYVALAFGATDLSYYCYAMPKTIDNGKYNAMYNACMLDIESKPTTLYEYVKKINTEIQSFAPAFFAYKYVKTFGITNSGAGGSIPIKMLEEKADFSDRKYIEDISDSDGHLLVGCFESERGEAYVLVNYGDPARSFRNEVTIKLKGGAKYIAVYGGEDSEAKIMKPDSGGITLILNGGEGKYIVPLQ